MKKFKNLLYFNILILFQLLIFVPICGGQNYNYAIASTVVKQQKRDSTDADIEQIKPVIWLEQETENSSFIYPFVLYENGEVIFKEYIVTLNNDENQKLMQEAYDLMHNITQQEINDLQRLDKKKSKQLKRNTILNIHLNGKKNKLQINQDFYNFAKTHFSSNQQKEFANFISRLIAYNHPSAKKYEPDQIILYVGEHLAGYKEISEWPFKEINIEKMYATYLQKINSIGAVQTNPENPSMILKGTLAKKVVNLLDPQKGGNISINNNKLFVWYSIILPGLKF